MTFILRTKYTGARTRELEVTIGEFFKRVHSIGLYASLSLSKGPVYASLGSILSPS